jgi:hypothetical protein
VTLTISAAAAIDFEDVTSSATTVTFGNVWSDCGILAGDRAVAKTW